MQYHHVLFLALGALLLLLYLLVLRRRRWWPPASRLQDLLNRSGPQENTLYHHYLVPLLAYEEEFPAFGQILALVLSHFPLETFLQKEPFRQSLESLRLSVFATTTRDQLVDEMSSLIQLLRSNPEVEYECRPHLNRLIQKFLSEIDS